jgi:mitogen-activated protein kinase 15
MLKALLYLHSGQLLHRDIKPSNILLNTECQAKLCDFGLVRSFQGSGTQEAVLTEHLATRWYRAPEILLGSQSYGPGVDVWSLGCIVAEFYHRGRPLFQGGSTVEQIELIVRMTGLPSAQDLADINSKAAEHLLAGIVAADPKPLQEILPTAPPEAL